MFADADHFLDAIWAAPHDDTPRMVYADWLDDHGYTDYAQFIRLSCHLDRAVLPPDERVRIRRERYRLGQAVAKANPGAFPFEWTRLSGPDFGIPGRWLTMEAADFLKNWPHWGPFIRPRSLTLLNICGHEVEVSRCEYLRKVDALEIEGRADGMYYDDAEREQVNWWPASGVMLPELATSPTTERLTALKVAPVAATPADLEAFATSPIAVRLTELHLWVQFADGGREDLKANGGNVRDEIARFLAEHAHRLSRSPS